MVFNKPELNLNSLLEQDYKRDKFDICSTRII